MDTKRCTKCKELRPHTKFGRHKYTRDGLNSWCNICKAALSSKYEREHPERKREKAKLYYQRHKAEVLERNKRYTRTPKAIELRRARAPKYAEQKRQDMRKRYAENKERLQAQNKTNALKNKAAYAKRKAAYSKEHLVERRAADHKREAIKRGNGGTFTRAEWEALCTRYENRCLMCNRTDVRLTADHVLPISCGGSNSIDNIQPLCVSCNSTKHTKTIDLRY